MDIYYMKPLSPNNASVRITPLIVLSIIGFFIIAFLLRNTVLWFVLGISSFTGVSFFYVKRIYNRTENVFYDTDALYLKNRYTTRKVNFQNIKRIERTLSDRKVIGILYYKYKIEFINEFKTNDSINILVNSIDDHMTEFEKKLDNSARNVSIKHVVNPFDRYEV